MSTKILNGEDLFGEKFNIIKTPKIRKKSLFGDYEAFVQKFETKKTTDDCYTPPEVYDAVLRWLDEEVGISHRPIVRPFFPGGDFENTEYPPDCVVVDNPPFSILKKICNFYIKNNIDFFYLRLT